MQSERLETGVRAFLFAVAMLAPLALPAAAKAAEQQVECSLPSGQVSVLSRSACRERAGLVVRALGTPEPETRRSPDPLPPGQYGLLGLGSGFFVNHGGSVLTNAHVVNECDALLVQPSDAGPAPARLSARDEALDLAVLETQLRPPRVAEIRAAPDAAVGDGVIIVGFPGAALGRWPHIGVGMVTRLATGDGRLVHLSFLGHAEGGMSGGPLLDEQGRVAGVVFAASMLDPNQSWRDHGSAIEAPAVREFLSRHKVPYKAAGAGGIRNFEQVAAAARTMTVRVLCLVGP